MASKRVKGDSSRSWPINQRAQDMIDEDKAKERDYWTQVNVKRKRGRK